MDSVRQDPAGGRSRVDSGTDVAAEAAAALLLDVRVRALARTEHAPLRVPRARRWACFLTIVLHVAIVAGLRIALRTPPVVSDQSVVQVDLIAAPKPAPPLPEPAPLPRAIARTTRHQPAAAAVPEAAAVAPAPVPEAAAPPEPRLFDREGSALVPGDLVEQMDRARPKPDFIAHDPVPSPLLQPRRPLKLRPNHFAQYWAGTDGMSAGKAMWRHVTFVKEFTAPWGGHYACAWILVVVACGDVPDKPWIPPQTWKPATELDER